MKLDTGQRRAVLSHPAGWIASGFGSGLSPFAPGTAGSAAALLPWLGMSQLAWPWVLGLIALTFALGVWASNVVIRRLGISDPGVIVVDEFVGQWIALLPLLCWPHGWIGIGLGFLLFRAFDVLKPWPCSWADRKVKGGFGVILDDALAGGYAALALGLIAVLTWKP